MAPTSANLETADLDAAVNHIENAPSRLGSVELIVRRPAVGEREILDEAQLEPGRGLVGDNHLERGNAKMPDGMADPLAELNVMNARVLAAVAGADRARWALAGDQLIDRFGIAAARWINSRPDLRLRGINAVVVTAGSVSTGDSIERR